ncbi:VOC family protein [Streptomyces sp. 147326]|uniref:VOC family protein n=1 Tax=Streptomyces sp. 147326 TaxID=3074379 RepID=UPI003857867B
MTQPAEDFHEDEKARRPVRVVTAIPEELDHIVYATPRLEETVGGFTDLTGVRPVAGGSHPGRGTRNCLVALGDRSYLEFIGPDPEQPAPAQPRPFGIDRLTTPAVATWVLRPADFDVRVKAFCERGYDPGRILTMSRAAADGTRLTWRLTDVDAGHPSGLVPFLIDWGSSWHPTRAALPEVTLTGLVMRAPDAPEVSSRLRALGVRAAVTTGPRRLAFTVDGPTGPVTFG